MTLRATWPPLGIAHCFCCCRKPKYDLDKMNGAWKKATPLLGNVLELLTPNFHRKARCSRSHQGHGKGVHDRHQQASVPSSNNSSSSSSSSGSSSRINSSSSSGMKGNAWGSRAGKTCPHVVEQVMTAILHTVQGCVLRLCWYLVSVVICAVCCLAIPGVNGAAQLWLPMELCIVADIQLLSWCVCCAAVLGLE